MLVEDERKSKKSGGGILAKFKASKKAQIVVVIFIIAIALIIYSSVIGARQTAGEDVSAAMTSEEQRLCSVLKRVEGAGEVDCMITTRGGNIVGVLVLADGAASVTVRLRLTQAAAAALGIDSQLVSVLTRN